MRLTVLEQAPIRDPGQAGDRLGALDRVRSDRLIAEAFGSSADGGDA